ncbi:MAG TPA: DUF4332 domain-containing protein [Bacteroidales bacterium]|nr:DUF4332 domain-containing protein [Bacteroidales bacterium]
MSYYLDLEKISIDQYREKLESSYMPPSRMILKEKLNERFSYFKTMGIKNVKELVQLLKKKGKIDELSRVSCLSGDYLTILLRELNSLQPKPNKISDFPGISKETISKLEKTGINNTEKLFYKVIRKTDRQKLAKETGIDEKDILELAKLSDLSRIKWVGVTFARMLFELGIDSVEKAAATDASDLHQRIAKLNKEKSIYKGQIGLNDMRIFVEAAKEIQPEIEY